MRRSLLLSGFLSAFSVMFLPLAAFSQTDLEVEKTTAGETSRETEGEAAFFRLEEEIVTSAAKYAQKITEAPSAVSVITAEDIQRSGTLELIQVFRFTPGVMVVENNSLGRDMLMRGYPQSFSPRLLVLMDGFPLYTPLFSGVTWAFLPLSLPGIERIEIVRGASSTLYGANAFSGVVNIINKPVDKSGSFYAYASGGNLELTQEEFVWNRPLSDSIRFRFSGLFRHDDGYGAGNGNSQFDGQIVGQGMLDFEFDLSRDTQLKLAVYGKGGTRKEVFGFLGQQRPEFFDLISGVRLSHALTPKQDLRFQFYFQEFRQSGFTSTPSTQTRREFHSELQYTNHIADWTTLVAGASVRHGGYQFLNFTPLGGLQRLTLGSVFVNEDFKILSNLILTVGGRYEFDSFTKNQIAGRGNLTYSPFVNQAFRVSVARAVRTPSVIEERLNLRDVAGTAPAPLPPTTLTDALGNSNLKPESVLAFEFGYLGRFFDNRLSANLQFYFNKVYDFITLGVSRVDLTSTPPRLTANFNNRGDGDVYGIEAELGYDIAEWWRTSVNYTLTRQRRFETGNFPKNIVNFKNRFVFKKGFSAELLFNWTDNYSFFDVFAITANPIGDIFRLDVRLAQKFFKDRFEVAVVGQNLIDAPHAEFVAGNRIDRLIYGVLSFRY